MACAGETNGSPASRGLSDAMLPMAPAHYVWRHEPLLVAGIKHETSCQSCQIEGQFPHICFDGEVGFCDRNFADFLNFFAGEVTGTVYAKSQNSVFAHQID